VHKKDSLQLPGGYGIDMPKTKCCETQARQYCKSGYQANHPSIHGRMKELIVDVAQPANFIKSLALLVRGQFHARRLDSIQSLSATNSDPRRFFEARPS